MADIALSRNDTFKAELDIDRQLDSAFLETLDGVDPAENRTFVVGGTPSV
jgi:hypothetical protein